MFIKTTPPFDHYAPLPCSDQEDCILFPLQVTVIEAVTDTDSFRTFGTLFLEEGSLRLGIAFIFLVPLIRFESSLPMYLQGVLLSARILERSNAQIAAMRVRRCPTLSRDPWQGRLPLHETPCKQRISVYALLPVQSWIWKNGITGQKQYIAIPRRAKDDPDRDQGCHLQRVFDSKVLVIECTATAMSESVVF